MAKARNREPSCPARALSTSIAAAIHRQLPAIKSADVCNPARHFSGNAAALPPAPKRNVKPL